MARADRKEGHEAQLPELIRRQIGTVVNRRHLSRMPAFALDREFPDDLTRLLADMDATELAAGRLSTKA